METLIFKMRRFTALAAMVLSLTNFARAVDVTTTGNLSSDLNAIIWSNLVLPSGGGIITFTTNVENDIHIDLAATQSTSGELAEVVIGGWNGNESEFRTGRGVSNPAGHFIVGIRRPKAQYTYQVVVDPVASTITVTGAAGPLIYQYNPSFLNNKKYIGFGSWTAPVTFSNITVAPLAKRNSITTGLTAADQLSTKPDAITWDYSWKLPNDDGGVISFTANATNDIHVDIIAANKNINDPLAEIVLGGWGGNESEFRMGRGVSNPDPLAHSKTGINTNATYTITVDRTKDLITVTGAKVSPISYQYPSGFLADKKFIGFGSWNNPITYSNITISSLPTIITPTSADRAQVAEFVYGPKDASGGTTANTGATQMSIYIDNQTAPLKTVRPELLSDGSYAFDTATQSGQQIGRYYLSPDLTTIDITTNQNVKPKFAIDPIEITQPIATKPWYYPTVNTVKAYIRDPKTGFYLGYGQGGLTSKNPAPTTFYIIFGGYPVVRPVQ